jgi:S1-C subfamily serine protease
LFLLGELDPEVADYLVMASEQELPRAGKLGVLLDLDETPPSVKGFGESSGAAEAGVKRGDKLLSIDGSSISSYADIRIALLDKAVGDTVEVEVERKRLFLGIRRKKITVTLN